MAEESAANDIVLWAVQLEKEGLSRLEDAKLSAAPWLPEINFVRSSTPREVGEPVVVRDSHVESHAPQPARILSQKVLIWVGKSHKTGPEGHTPSTVIGESNSSFG